MFGETLKLALRAIRRNLLRSFLTVLGVVIGVAAVIAMVTIGNGTTAQVTTEIAKLGTNLLFVRPGQFGPGRAATDAKKFTVRDIEAIREQIPGLRAVAAITQSSQTVIFGGQSRQTTIIGSGADYLVAQNWDLASGRSFLPSARRSARNSSAPRPPSTRRSGSAMSPARSSASWKRRARAAWAAIRTMSS
jgi:putative ABC transport system permease protein